MALIEIVIKTEEIKMLMVIKKIIEMMMQAKIEEKDFSQEAVKEGLDKIEMIDHIETQMRGVIEIIVRIEIIIQMIENLIDQVDMIDLNPQVDQKELIDIKEMINLIKEIEMNSRVEIDMIKMIDQKDPIDLIDQKDKRDPISQKDQIDQKIDKIDQINHREIA